MNRSIFCFYTRKLAEKASLCWSALMQAPSIASPEEYTFLSVLYSSCCEDINYSTPCFFYAPPLSGQTIQQLFWSFQCKYLKMLSPDLFNVVLGFFFHFSSMLRHILPTSFPGHLIFLMRKHNPWKKKPALKFPHIKTLENLMIICIIPSVLNIYMIMVKVFQFKTV